MEDRELLQDYAQSRSEAAFTELVERHVNLVYTTARRMVGDAHLAKDVAQMVFIGLARKPWAVRQPEALAGWLYGATRNAAGQALRTEVRRRNREAEAMTRVELEQDAPDAWAVVAPLLDTAMRELKPVEMNAVVLRYFEGKSLAETGRALALSENAAQKRVTRALEKLRAYFARSGVTVSAGLLAAALSANTVQAAPAGLGAALSGQALAGAGSGGALGVFLKTLYMTTKTKSIIAAAAILAATAVVTITEQQEITRLRTELAVLHQGKAGANDRRNAPRATAATSVQSLKSKINDIIKNYHGAARIVALANLVAESPTGEMAQLLRESASIADADARQTLFKLALSKWADADPAGALAFAQTKATADSYTLIGSGRDIQSRATWNKANRDAMDNVFDTWASRDPRAALEAALQLDRASYRTTAIAQVMATWVMHADPATVLAAAKNLPGGITRTTALSAIFDRWSQLDPNGALAAVAQIEHAGQRNNLQAVIVKNLANSDPGQALSALRGLAAGQQSPSSYGHVFAAWAKQDPTVAYAALQQLPMGAAREAATNSLFTGWAEVDPVGALQNFQAVPAGSVRKSLERTLLNQLIAEDPATVTSYWAAMPLRPDRTRELLIPSLVDNWSDADPAAALAWLNANGSGPGYDASIELVLKKMSDQDPMAAMNYVLQLPEGDRKKSDLSIALGTFAENDPVAAMVWLNQNLADVEREAGLATVVNRLAVADPAAAIPLYNQLPAGAERDGIAATLAGALAAQDTEAALAWAQNLPVETPDEIRSKAMQSVVTTWVATDPMPAAAYVQAHASEPGMAGAIEQIASTWADSDSPAAMSWAQSLPEGDGRTNALIFVAGKLASTDPQTAWNVVASLPEGSRPAATQQLIILKWSAGDPVGASNAVWNIGDRAARFNAVSQLAESWVHQDPPALAKWLQGLPSGEERDVAALRYVAAQTASDPLAAYAVAVSISDPTRRFNQIRNNIRAWASKDRPAAVAALEGAPITDEQKATIQELIN